MKLYVYLGLFLMLILSGCGENTSTDSNIRQTTKETTIDNWEFTTFNKNRIDSPISIVDDLIIFRDRAGYFYAVDKATGKEIWKLAREEMNTWSEIKFFDGVAYFESSYLLNAVNLENGKSIWTINTLKDNIPSADPTDSSNKKVYFKTKNHPFSKDGHVIAVDSKTGKQLWKFGGDLPGSVMNFSVLNNVVIFGTKNGIIYAIDDETGVLKWKIETDSTIDTPHLLSNNTFYYESNDGIFYAIDLTDKKVKWSLKNKNKSYNLKDKRPQLHDDIIYHTDDNVIHAVNSNNGQKLWYFAAGNTINHISIDDGTIYFGCDDSYVYAIDIKTGKLNRKESLTRLPVDYITVDDMFYYYTRSENEGFTLYARNKFL